MNGLVRPVSRFFSTCLRKHKWRSPETAEKEAERLQLLMGEPFHTYWCGYCMNYHVGRPRDGYEQ